MPPLDLSLTDAVRLAQSRPDGICWQTEVAPLTPMDRDEGWSELTGLSDLGAQIVSIQRLHGYAAAHNHSYPPGDRRVWERPFHSMWVLASKVVAPLPALLIGNFANDGRTVVDASPSDVAFKLEADGAVDLRLLPTASAVRSPNSNTAATLLMQRIREAVNMCGTVKNDAIVNGFAARIWGDHAVSHAHATAPTAARAATIARSLVRPMGEAFSAYANIDMLRVGERAMLRCVPVTCCHEDLRLRDGIRCGSCPNPMTADKEAAWVDYIATHGAVLDRAQGIPAHTPVINLTLPR